MDGYSADEVRDAQRPLASLISKSEKSRQKVAPGTWQNTMLRDNIKALRIASELLEETGAEDASRDDLQEARAALVTMIERVAATEAKFAPETSQHTLQRNRLKALRIALAAVDEELAKRVPTE